MALLFLHSTMGDFEQHIGLFVITRAEQPFLDLFGKIGGIGTSVVDKLQFVVDLSPIDGTDGCQIAIAHIDLEGLVASVHLAKRSCGTQFGHLADGIVVETAFDAVPIVGTCLIIPQRAEGTHHLERISSQQRALGVKTALPNHFFEHTVMVTVLHVVVPRIGHAETHFLVLLCQDEEVEDVGALMCEVPTDEGVIVGRRWTRLLAKTQQVIGIGMIDDAFDVGNGDGT